LDKISGSHSVFLLAMDLSTCPVQREAPQGHSSSSPARPGLRLARARCPRWRLGPSRGPTLGSRGAGLGVVEEHQVRGAGHPATLAAVGDGVVAARAAALSGSPRSGRGAAAALRPPPGRCSEKASEGTCGPGGGRESLALHLGPGGAAPRAGRACPCRLPGA
jgi:hypothetical protein